MRAEFKLYMSGKDSFRDKLAKAIKDKPKLHIELMTSIGHLIMKTIELDDSDEISIDGFRLGEHLETKVEEKS
jgi:hypothetical protein